MTTKEKKNQTSNFIKNKNREIQINFFIFLFSNNENCFFFTLIFSCSTLIIGKNNTHPYLDTTHYLSCT